MKIISWNVNGLRAVQKRGFGKWLKECGADIVCLQEIKLQEKDLPSELKNPEGYFGYFSFAKKPGYSGVAIFSKQKPLKVIDRSGFNEFDEQGRILRLDFQKLVLLNLYMPHGGRGKEKLNFKLRAYKYLFRYIDSKLRGDNKRVLLIGDFNIAHKEIDLARPKQNKNNIMFTPEERAQIDKMIECGFADLFRKLHPAEKEFTWWPYFANARDRNLGWRIDYIFGSTGLSVKRAEILNKINGSDHCPVLVELK